MSDRWLIQRSNFLSRRYSRGGFALSVHHRSELVRAYQLHLKPVFGLVHTFFRLDHLSAEPVAFQLDLKHGLEKLVRTLLFDRYLLFGLFGTFDKNVQVLGHGDRVFASNHLGRTKSRAVQGKRIGREDRRGRQRSRKTNFGFGCKGGGGEKAGVAGGSFRNPSLKDRIR